jgi:protein-S-isoprenylcysteine O-methyltransferase Ste14
VTTGPIRLVRNAVFTAAAIAFLGLTLMVPNLVVLAGLVVILVGIQIQVRLVEEPYLRRAHGAYSGHASRVGRFLPGFGRLRSGRSRTSY